MSVFTCGQMTETSNLCLFSMIIVQYSGVELCGLELGIGQSEEFGLFI